jgi:hypothetical protein
MCELIVVRMWEKLEGHRRSNPGFNSRDDVHYKKAMKELSIYEIKRQFLEAKGFQAAWGNPNEVFYKLLESTKQRNSEVKAEASKIEAAFDKTVESIASEPENFNPQRIKFFMEEKIQQKPEAATREVRPQPRIAGPAVSKSMTQVASKKNDDEDFSLDSLMMQELLSRSEEPPKPVEEKVEVQAQEQQLAEPE